MQNKIKGKKWKKKKKIHRFNKQPRKRDVEDEGSRNWEQGRKEFNKLF